VLVDEFELSLGELAERVGARSRPSRTVCACSSCPTTSSGWSSAVSSPRVTARAVLAVPDNDGRRRLARKIVPPGLSVRGRGARGALVRRRDEAPAPPPRPIRSSRSA
jgi:hypothetical protein